MHNIILSYGRPAMTDNVNRVLAEAEETAGAAEQFEEPAVKQPAAIPSFITYKELEWEVKAAQKPGTNQKQSFTYDEHEARLKEEGWDRAPTPQEYIRLITDHFEGKLEEPFLSVALDMISHGKYEWTCHAMQRKGEKLHIYENFTGLRWNQQYDRYTLAMISGFENEEEFEIPNLVMQGPYSLRDINQNCPKLITYLYTTPYKDLPALIQNEGKICIPATAKLSPIGFYKTRFKIGPSFRRASRGVRKIGGTNA